MPENVINITYHRVERVEKRVEGEQTLRDAWAESRLLMPEIAEIAALSRAIAQMEGKPTVYTNT